MKNSSNNFMELEILTKIQQVEPKDELYTQILEKIQQKNTISWNWVRIAACFFIIALATEYTLVHKKNTQLELANLLPQNSNILYYE